MNPKGTQIQKSEYEDTSSEARGPPLRQASLLSSTQVPQEIEAQRFTNVKSRIRELLDHSINPKGKIIKRFPSPINAEEILRILKEMKQPVYGVGLPKHVKVDFMQKYYQKKIMIFGVNKQHVYAFRYQEDRRGLPISFTFLDKMYVNMSKGEKYQARSKLDDGFVFCSKEEIFTIRFDTKTGNLRRDVLLLLSNIKDDLDEHNTENSEEGGQDYARINDDSLSFGEAKLFRTEDTDLECVLFSLHSEYSITKEGGLVMKKSSMALIYQFGENPKIVKYLETSGHISNLSLAMESLKANKLYYLENNLILENYFKVFGVSSRKGKMSQMTDRFNYEKKVYLDSNTVQQFEFDGKKKFLISLSEGKVKKINKYDKKAVPVYFEMERPVDDFAVSGNYIYTGDKNKTLNIWNSVTEKKLNNLPLDISQTDSLISLPELEEEDPYQPDEDEDPFDRLIDIIVNDDYSELIVILKDMILFWHIPTIFSEVNVNRNISSRSAICLQRNSNNMLLNCGNQTVITLRRDSFKKLDAQNLPESTFFVKLTAYEDYFFACREVLEQEHKVENIFLKPEEKIEYTGKNIVYRRRREVEDVEVFRTELEITSLEVVYRSQLENSTLFKAGSELHERLDAGPTPEIALVILLDGEELMLVILDKDGKQIEAKNLNRLSPDHPQFMKSTRDIVKMSRKNSKVNISIENLNPEENQNASSGNEEESREDFQRFDSAANLITPVFTRSKTNHIKTQNRFDLDESDEEMVPLKEKRARGKSSYRFFEFFPEIGYFIGYLEQVNNDGMVMIHFVMLNPFRKSLTKLFLPNAYIEKEHRNKRNIKYRVFCQQVIDQANQNPFKSQIDCDPEEKKGDNVLNEFCFYAGLTSQMGTVIVKIDLLTGKIKKHGEFGFVSHRGASAQVCGRVNHLYIPEKNRIEVIDLDCCDRIYTIELEGDVLDIYKGKEGKQMAVIDMNFLYTIDVSSLQIIKKTSLSNRKKQSKMMVFDMNFLWELREIRIPEFSQDVTMLKKVDLKRLSGLKYLPVDHLSNCFSKQDNQKSIFAFAEYYSNAVDQMGGHDFLFGALNPFTLAIFYSEELILLRLLEKINYPLKVHGFLTPIEYCVQNRENDCLRILCTMLVKKKIKIFMTYREFQALLDLDFTFGHDLLAMAPRSIPFDKLIFAGSVKNDVEIKFSESLFHFMIENEQLQQQAENNPTEKQIKMSRQRVEIFYVPFKYEMETGSKESLDFLENYTSSESHDFILSKWRNMIYYKWSKLRYLFAFNAIIFWVYMFFCTYAIVFNIETDGNNNIKGEKSSWVRYTAVGLNIVIALLEFLQMLAYCLYNPKIYFGDFWNYIDVFTLVFAFVFFMGLYKITEGDGSDYVALILMLLIYYRGFSYFRFFSSFVSMIGMINTIVASSGAFFGTLFYAYFSIFFLFVRADPGRNIFEKLRDSYIFLLFGGLEQPHFFPRIIMFPMVIGTMIVTIILLNVLIAFMSNVYNRMEQLQEITALKERSSMLLDLEVYISLFRRIRESAKGIYKDEEYRESQRKLVFWFKKIEGVQGSLDKNNTFAKIAKMEVDVARLKNLILNLKNKNEKDFTSVKKKIKGINKFFGYHQNELSHFDAKMHSLMISMFENFGMSVAGSVKKKAEEHPELKKYIK